MSTLIQGACMKDPNTVPPSIPFQLGLIPMLCYRDWVDSTGYSGVTLSTHASEQNDTSECLFEHYVNCNSTPHRPLIMTKNFTTIIPILENS